MKRDQGKTKEQLINEVVELRQRIAELETSLTESKRVEKTLKEIGERYLELFKQSSIGIGIASLDGKVINGNRAMEVITGYTLEELKNINLADTYENLKDRKRLLEMVNQYGYVTNYQVRLKRKDGTPYDAILGVSRVHLKGQDVLQTTCIDNTEHKKAEEKAKQLQQELILASRLATVGQMAAGIAHEINNPLTGVIGYSQLLMKTDIPADVRGRVHIIYEGAQRIDSIVKRMLTFAHQQKPKRALVNINGVIKNTLEMLAYEMGSSAIKLTTELDPNLPRTIADAGQLQQVFLNIILNAEAEMVTAHGGGNLLVKTERIDDAIRVSIKDDGPGIARKNLRKIFDPFFTTREVGRGAGLGLSVCYGIVTGHGGKIYAESRLGKGATLFVELPIVISPKS